MLSGLGSMYMALFALSFRFTSVEFYRICIRIPLNKYINLCLSPQGLSCHTRTKNRPHFRKCPMSAFEYLFNSSSLDVVVPDTSLAFPTQSTADKWLETVNSKTLERDQAFFGALQPFDWLGKGY